MSAALRSSLALFVSALLVPAALWANGGGYIAGTPSQGALGSFQPKHAQDIEMVTEDLRIDLHMEYGHIEVDYTLHNPGGGVTAEVGFPCKALTSLRENRAGGDREDELNKTPPLRNFTVVLDGTPLTWATVRDEKGKEDLPRTWAGQFRYVPYWCTFKMPFSRNQSRHLHVSYDTDYFAEASWVSSDGETKAELLSYLFSTAAVWKGPIQEGKVTIQAKGLPADQVRLNQPKRFQREGNAWTWSFKNFEPGLGDDLIIAAHPAYSSFERYPTGATDGHDRERMVDFVHLGSRWEMHHHDYTVTASSTHKPVESGNNEVRFTATNVADGNWTTVWAAGGQGDGVGEELHFSLRTPRRISEIRIGNGYPGEDDSKYARWGRVAQFGVSINGDKSFTVDLPDESLRRHLCLIPVPARTGMVKSIQLKIQKVYPGSEYQSPCVHTVLLVTPLSKEPKLAPIR